MCPSGIDAIAWSLCGQLIAVAQSDSAISILDSTTLERLHTMHPPPGTKVFVFSPDSRLLLCCGVSPDVSGDFVVAWEAQTGGAVGSGEALSRPIGRPLFIASSSGGDMIGVAYALDLVPNTFEIRIYNVRSREHVCSHPSEGLLVGIWTHGEYLRFAIILPTEGMAVWQVKFAPGQSPSKVANGLAAPPNLDPARPLLFDPTLHRVSYISEDTLYIWDSLNERHLLYSEDVGFNESAMAFSPDGRLFACGTIGSDIHLWEDHEGDYTIHRKFTSSVISPTPVFSPDNGSVIVWNHTMLQLFSLKDLAALASIDAPQTSGRRSSFTVEFSPGEEYIAFARLGSNQVAVVGRRSRDWRLEIDAGMEVHGFKISGNTIIVEGEWKLVTWDLGKEGDMSAGGTVTVKDSTRTAMLKMRNRGPKFTSISPDHLMLAAVSGAAGSLTIYNMETGVKIGGVKTDCDTPWFSPDGNQVWCSRDVGEVQGWKVVKSNGSLKVKLDPLTGSPPEGWPWRPPPGYEITDDGRILDPKDDQLLLLPPDWISKERGMRVWNGKFLALLHGTLSEPVILELK